MPDFFTCEAQEPLGPEDDGEDDQQEDDDDHHDDADDGAGAEGFCNDLRERYSCVSRDRKRKLIP